MDIQDIVTLIHAVDETDVTNFELTEEAFSLKIDKRDRKGKAVAMVSPVSSVPVMEPVSTAADSADTSKKEKEDPGVKVVTSPMVGTFYRAPGPDADEYVRNGERIDAGQTLCIIEAMKLMNEIESDYAGEVVGILVEDGEMVEYGQPLFKIKV